MKNMARILYNYCARFILGLATVIVADAAETYSGNCISFTIPDIVYTDSLLVRTGDNHVDYSNAHLAVAMKAGIWYNLVLQVWKIPDDKLAEFSASGNAESVRELMLARVGDTFQYPVPVEVADQFPNGEMLVELIEVGDLKHTESGYPYYTMEIYSDTAEEGEGSVFVAYCVNNDHLLELTYSPVYHSGYPFPEIVDLIFNSFSMSSENVE